MQESILGTSGRFRNLEKGVQPLACKSQPKNLGGAMPTSGHVNAWAGLGKPERYTYNSWKSKLNISRPSQTSGDQ